MFYTENELSELGFKSFGKNVLISDKCSIYGAKNIEIGSNVRIDDFCILSANGNIKIGNNIHIACYASLIGRGDIILEDFSSIAARCTILSSCDDFSGEYLVNPTIPKKFLNVTHGDVVLKKHAVLGVSCVVLPNTVISEGSAVGAMSLVKKTIPEYEIWGGNPIKFIKKRKRNLKQLEEKYLNEI